jgi:GNAT superfamily N-acetyltransferase
MTGPSTPTKLAAKADVERCADVLAHAFLDDPGTLVIAPDPVQRAAFLPLFFRSFIAASLAEGANLVVPAGTLDGVAAWFGPGIYGPTIESLLANGFGEALAGLGEDGTERLTAMVGELEAQHDRLTAGREHLRLAFFGVDPIAQGRGIGGALADVGHRRADRLGLPCYLETFTLANVRFYEHRGYRVIDQFPVGDAVPAYAMERPPTPASPQ